MQERSECALVCAVIQAGTGGGTLVPTPPLNVQAVLNQICLFLSFKTLYPHTTLTFSLLERGKCFETSVIQNRENIFPAHLWL